jgi:hypothetical protein
MVEVRESHALQSKLHASLDAVVHQLYRLRLTVQAVSFSGKITSVLVTPNALTHASPTGGVRYHTEARGAQG